MIMDSFESDVGHLWQTLQWYLQPNEVDAVKEIIVANIEPEKLSSLDCPVVSTAMPEHFIKDFQQLLNRAGMQALFVPDGVIISDEERSSKPLKMKEAVHILEKRAEFEEVFWADPSYRRKD